MALIVADRVKETTTTTGTGTLSLAGAVAGFQSFVAGVGTTNTTYYAITDSATGDWEVGIGTVTSGTPDTLSRDTVLESSNSDNLVNFGVGQKIVICTQPAEKAVYLDASDQLVINGTSVTATAAELNYVDGVTSNVQTQLDAKVAKSGDTMTGFLTLHADPTSAFHAATKEYVDTIASASLHYHDPVRVESPVNLTATYNNGTSGVGATLTNAGTQAALVIDGVTLSLNDRVLIYQQTDATQNGVYYVSDVGSASTNWVLTRTTDTDSYGASDPNALGTGDAFFVTEGNTGAGELYVMNTEGAITFGTTNIMFSQISSAQIYSAGAGLDLTGTVFSHTDTSSQASVNNSNGTVIQDITLDTFGHITALGSVDLDGRYYTETEIDATVSGLNSAISAKQDAATALTTSTTFGGDVSGTYNAIVVANDSHTHDTRYYTETEIGSFFGGTTAITGYNKTNWDTAYGWGNHASVGYLTGNQTITLSGDASGSGTTSIVVTVANDSHTHDTRYYTETEADSRFANITGDTFTGNVLFNSKITLATTSSYLLGAPTHGFRFNNDTDTINALIVNNSGDAIAHASHRAPIFYDSNNTAYYTNPASTSVLNNLTVGPITSSVALNNTTALSVARLNFDGDGTDSFIRAQNGNRIRLTTTGGADVIIGNTSGLNVSGAAYSVFNRPTPTSYQTVALFGSPSGGLFLTTDSPIISNGAYFNSGWIGTKTGTATYLSLINGLNFSTATATAGVGGVSFATRFEVTSGGNATATADFRAPIFYDSNNTGYYVDPASTTNIALTQTHDLRALGQIRATGWYNQNSSSHNGPAVEIGVSAPNSSAGFIIGYNRNSSSYINLNFSANAFIFTGQSGGFLTVNSSVRAPLFYDSNDTNYYTDPASTSVLASVKAKTAFYHGSLSYWKSRDNTGGTEFVVEYGTSDALSDANIKFKVNTGGNATATGSFSAPIFYDSNDTNYRLDPNGTSILNTINLENVIRHNGDTNTYIEFHAEDQFRVVTGGSERFEVNDTNTTVQNNFNTNGLVSFYRASGYPLVLMNSSSTGTSTIQLGPVGDSDKTQISSNASNGVLNIRANNAHVATFSQLGINIGSTSVTSAAFEASRGSSSSATHFSFNSDYSNLICGYYFGNISIISTNPSGFGTPGIVFGNYAILPGGGTFYGTTDDRLDLGSSSARWDDVYATNGTIQTSDRRLKQDIAPLTEAELNAAARISKLFVKYRWKSSVAEKLVVDEEGNIISDPARTHVGVIAQDLSEAMAQEGLDARNYGFFIHTEWWTCEVEVPAVEEVPEVLDENNQVITPYVPAQEACMRPFLFYSQDEIDKAIANGEITVDTELTYHDRMAVRYPALLSFISAYNEQRLNSIEQRLSNLEG